MSDVHPVVHLWDCICNWAEIIANDGKDANLTPPDWLFDAVIAATSPPQKEWVGLTDADIKEGADLSRLYPDQFEPVARWAESKLKEKNHGAI